jgi:GNAT superfamily N-acetyltransferase
MDSALTIRTMTRDEVDIAIDWARDEGWNPGIHDAESFYATDPAGFFIAECEGRCVATAVVTNYDDNFAFGGLFIVTPGFRNRGAGSAIGEYALRHAGKRNLGIDGVLEMAPKYQKRDGFLFAYKNIRFEGTGGGKHNDSLVPAGEVSQSELLSFDSVHFPAERKAFLSSWLNQPDSRSFAALTRDGAIAGYGTIRRCFSGYKIGPLFACSPAAAEEIFHGLIAWIPGEPVFFDTPEPNAAAVDIAVRHGMQKVFETARMYTKEIPDLPLEQIFGVTSFEMG